MNVQAIQEAWIIGDDFLRSAYHAYSSMYKRMKRAGESSPYILEHYNTSSHVMGDINGIKLAASRIQNCVVRQLNACKTMPRMIIIIPDYDVLITNLSVIEEYEFGARHICSEITKWLVDEIEDAVNDRKKQMKKIRHGSVMSNEPKIIYVKMVYRPKRSDIQALRNIFNFALENQLVNRHNHYILGVHTKNSDFDHTNCFTDKGI